AAATAKACNGSPDYCPLAFDQYTFMGSHNSAAYRLEPGCGIASKCRPEHDIATQLKDGIRSFDIDTCIANSNTVTCHGHNMFRALGDGLDVHIKQIKEFITQNPNEVIVIEYGDYLGDKNKTSNDIIAKLREHLDGKMLERTSISESWPTLDEMTKQGKQVVVF
ncbi:PLC-like phosphodiesterase, partial [Syncephalis fuscata]